MTKRRSPQSSQICLLPPGKGSSLMDSVRIGRDGSSSSCARSRSLVIGVSGAFSSALGVMLKISVGVVFFLASFHVSTANACFEWITVLSRSKRVRVVARDGLYAAAATPRIAHV